MDRASTPRIAINAVAVALIVGWMLSQAAPSSVSGPLEVAGWGIGLAVAHPLYGVPIILFLVAVTTLDGTGSVGSG